MSNNRPIGVFDSGLGGLTVVKELNRLLPDEDIVYFGDTGRVPYGNRSRETIRRYAKEDEAFLLKQDVKVIIAACGTVSSVAADISETLPIPFFEVVSHASKAAVKASKNGKIGVIGTAATIKSGKHREYILKENPNATVVCQSCPLFVPLVEEGWYSAEDGVVIETVRRYLEPMLDAEIDTLILGCTHYPLLTEAISEFFPEATLINAGAEGGEQIKRILEEKNMLGAEKGENEFFVSGDVESFVKNGSLFLGSDIKGAKKAVF